MKTLVFVAAAMLLVSVAAVASPIPGSSNELVNGDFESGAPTPWTLGAGLYIEPGVPGHGYAVYCKGPIGSLLLRQVVDESRNPLWNWNYHAKVIDLQADIRVVNIDHAPDDRTGIRFRLDWWDESYNSSNTQPNEPPTGYSGWATYYFNQIPGYQVGNWITANPFNNDLTIFRNFQPRWVSVEIELLQYGADQVWVDNVVLTSKCVPEPMSVMSLGLGVVAAAAAWRRRK